MRRTIEDALLAFRAQVKAWAQSDGASEIRVLVYPPEHEAQMLVQLPQTAEALSQEGTPVEVVDIGLAFRDELEANPERKQRLIELESQSTERLLNTLGQLGQRTVMANLVRPLPARATCRLVLNTGSLGTFVSYSAITNELQGSTEHAYPRTVIAFPGEGDDRSLNLLGLRADTNYRVGRI